MAKVRFRLDEFRVLILPKKTTRPLIIKAKPDAKTQALTAVHLVDTFESLILCFYGQE